MHWRKHARFWASQHHQHNVPKSEIKDFLAQLPSLEVCISKFMYIFILTVTYLPYWRQLNPTLDYNPIPMHYIKEKQC